MHKYVETGYIV